MKYYCIFDVETDGLLEEATTIHCLSYQIYDGVQIVDKGSLTDPILIVQFLFAQECLVGHNIIRYDIPVLEKILHISITCKVIDTLGISWYLYPDRPKHGLEEWGEHFGFSKKKITDWKGLKVEEYIERCEGDVEINKRLFLFQKGYLEALYDGNFNRMVGYISFKLACLKDQEQAGLKINVGLCLKTKQVLEHLINEKIEKLVEVMPAHLGKVLRVKPKLRTDSWFAFLAEQGVSPERAPWIVEFRDKPNPASHAQLKAWLYSLGWIPITFKLSKETLKKVPQISLPFGAGLCPSVKELYSVEPALQELDGLFVAQHRLSIINSFLEVKDKNDMVYSTAHGFTNTMRLQHGKPIVNLPSINKPFGKEIRGCIKIENPTRIMCGADVSGLEDNTKQHYIYFFDPKYVTEMRVPGFDPHIDVAVTGGMITKEEAEFFSWYTETHL